ncbi:hypothetical protein [Mesorhizobium captivum]|uniref:hypothetical protein n=1 Tax=Mesorhizobium captivum TaxID=3072319 RepID=UPI002A23CE87|nr:hypothetical protein [Mesorhizobium sp. VK23E]MDX8513410.1 hypothetical protein [Mesorhizobium sp. VK23E]
MPTSYALAGMFPGPVVNGRLEMVYERFTMFLNRLDGAATNAYQAGEAEESDHGRALS